MKEETKLNIAVITLGLIITFLLCSNSYYYNKCQRLEKDTENARLKQEIAKCNTVIDSLSNILDNDDSVLVWFYKPDLKKELK